MHRSIESLVENLALRQAKIDESLKTRESGSLSLLCSSLLPYPNVSSNSCDEDVCADDADRVPSHHEGQGYMLEDIPDDVQA